MEKYYTPDEVVDQRLIPGTTKASLAQMRYQGTGPRYVRISPRRIAYSESALAEFMASSEQASTRENAAAL